MTCSFRPLTGINFNTANTVLKISNLRFRPLTGINFNFPRAYTAGQARITFPSPYGDKFQLYRYTALAMIRLFPSPYGDKFQHSSEKANKRKICFRPLTGINFNDKRQKWAQATSFPSPYGDKFQLS